MPMTLNFVAGEYATAKIVCSCGRERTVRIDFGLAWKCECGLRWYVDPAGRAWGDEAIRYAHKTHGYFGKLFEEPA